MNSGTGQESGRRDENSVEPGPVRDPGESRNVDGTPLATVCIPTYRRPELLARAIGSVTGDAATASGCVELLVSDNSPAESESAARAALATWPGRSVYRAQEVNLGLVGNMNHCLAHATGRFVLILHDDDYLVPGGLGAILDRLRAASDDDILLAFGVEIVDANGHVLRTQAASGDRLVAPAAAARRLLTDSSYLRMPAVVVRRDAYLDTGGFRADLGGAEDLEMWLRLASRYGLRTVPAVVSAYTVHPAAATTRMFDQSSIETILRLFTEVEAMGVLDASEIRGCEQHFFHQFILGGCFRELYRGNTVAARNVLRLFDVPGVRALGWSRRWMPVRLVSSLTARLPGPVAAGVARAGARLAWPLLRWRS